jgi:MFS transporter, DHA1 family, multidrug resistance protein
LNVQIYTLHIAVVVVTFAIASATENFVRGLLGDRKMLQLALLLQSLGSFTLLFSDCCYLLTTAMAMYVIGFALIYPTIFSASMEIFPQMKGSASSAIMFLRYLLCASLTASCASLFTGDITSLGLVMLILSISVVILSIYYLSFQTS